MLKTRELTLHEKWIALTVDNEVLQRSTMFIASHFRTSPALRRSAMSLSGSVLHAAPDGAGGLEYVELQTSCSSGAKTMNKSGS